VLFPDHQAEFVVVALSHPHHAPLPGLAPELYAFSVIRQTNIPFKPRPNDPPIPISVVQSPLVSAASVSVYKIQGDTLDAMIIGNWRAPRKNPAAQAYVTVSRVRSRFSFAVLKEFTDDDATIFAPSAATLAEDDRLERICNEFVAQFRRSNRGI
jgi:hypothetical protein